MALGGVVSSKNRANQAIGFNRERRSHGNHTKKIIEACRLHFYGDLLLGEIAILLDVNPNTLSKWRQTQIWKDYYAELLEQYELAHAAAETQT